MNLENFYTRPHEFKALLGIRSYLILALQMQSKTIDLLKLTYDF